MGKKRSTESASPPAAMDAGAAKSKQQPQQPQHTPTILDPSSSSVSASFPYIKVGASETEKDSSSSHSVEPPKPGHARLSSLSSLRPKPDPVRAAAARSRFHALIRSQTLAAKGLPASSAVEIDIHAKDAPWRTDDSLLSPHIADQYLQYEPVVEMTLRCIDEAGSFPTVAAGSVPTPAQKEQLEFARYISLARFGETEQNAWKIFKRIAKQKRNDRAVVWLSSSGSIEKDWTFGDLYSRICVLSLHLRDTLKIAKGSRAILCFVPGLDFFVAFWACLSQGIVAVPVSPVDPFNPKSDVSEKLAQIVSSCSPSLFLTTSEYVSALDAGKAYCEQLKEGAPIDVEPAFAAAASSSAPAHFDLHSVAWTCVDSLDYSVSFDPSAAFADNVGNGFSLAFLQYTSGSTGAPKGVMVGHAHIVANVAGCTEETRAGRSFETYKKTVAVSFLPTFHDMGLQGFHMAPILTGTPIIYMSPLDFLADPISWLRALSAWSHKEQYQHVTTGAPPFVLDLCVKKLAALSPEQRSEIDLSGVLSVILGAEPIRASSMLAFASATQEMGFESKAFMPAYGLAENVLHVCGKKDNTYPPTLLHVEQQALSEGRLVEVDSSLPPIRAALRGPSKWLVACGELHSKDPAYWPGMRADSGTVLVVDPVTLREQPDGVIGEIWIAGRCVTAGYWNNASATASAYNNKLAAAVTAVGRANVKASFYRTGDLGCMFQDHLYITGRLKEMIIVNGTKHYPMDIEEAIRHATESGITVPARDGAARGRGPSAAAATEPTPRKTIRLRPGGVLATEMEHAFTGKNELIVMIELGSVAVHSDSLAVSASDASGAAAAAKDPSSSGGGGGDGKLSSSQVHLANAVFKYAQKLPPFLRTPTIKCVARLGARYQRYQKDSAAAAKAAAAAASSDPNATPGSGSSAYSTYELEVVEKTIRRAVIGRFGIPVADVIILTPRSILKTSSGKIRRLATVQLLSSGGLADSILRRSTDKLGLHGASAAAAASGAHPLEKRPDLLHQAAVWQEQQSSKAKAAVPSSRVPPRAASVKVDAAKATTGSTSKSSAPAAASGDSFELVSHSGSPISVSAASSASPLQLDAVKQTVATVLGEELHLDAETILLLSTSFQFDAESSLDEYGLDSLSAMKIAGRLTASFDLPIPISPFMFFSDPTMDGMCKLIIRLKADKGRITSAKDFKIMPAAGATAAAKQEAMAASSTAVKPAMAAAAAPANRVAASASVASSSSSSTSSSGWSSDKPYILGLGCAVPGPGAPQSAIMDVMISDMELPSEKLQKMFAKIGESAGIERRYSVLPSIESIYFGRKGLGNNECVDVRNAVFKAEAPLLSLESARAAITHWGGSKDDITHVVAVTCTGVIVPGLEFQILTGLGLSAHTQRLSITFMGCFGALSGMKAARAFAAESPTHRVLLVCTELCSLHMQLDSRIDNLVGSALFADGSGAMIVGQQPRQGETPLFEMHRNASVIIPDTLDMMSWELTSSGMSIGLGKEIPDAIYKYIDSFSAGMMADTEAAEANFDQCLWALHPGSGDSGPMILTAISDRLGLSPLHTSSAWTVLRKYGNMSSATLIFVLCEMLAQFALGSESSSALPPNCTPFIPALAFGPGLNVEGCLLKYVAGEVGVSAEADSKDKKEAD